MSCAGYYIAAITITFRSIPAGVWGVYVCVLAAGKAFTSSAIRKQDRGSQQLAWKSLIVVSPFLPTRLPMSCLLSMSSSHSQPRKFVMLCASQLPHSHSCQLHVPCTADGSIPILPPASTVGSFPCKRSNLFCQSQAVQPPTLQTY